MYHSYNSTDFEYIGRQVLLDEMLWNETTNWPYFKNGVSSVKAEMPFTKTEQQRNLNLVDDFSNDKNIGFCEWDVKQSRPKTQVKSGELLLTATHDGFNFIGIRPEFGRYELSSEVVQTGNPAGIGIYSNPENSVAFLVSDSDMRLVQINKGEEKTIFKQKIEKTGSVHLKIEAVSGRYLQFFQSENGEEWLPLKIGNDYQLDCVFMPQWNHAPRAGLLVQGKTGTTFRFGELKMKYLMEENQ